MTAGRATSSRRASPCTRAITAWPTAGPRQDRFSASGWRAPTVGIEWSPTSVRSTPPRAPTPPRHRSCCWGTAWARSSLKAYAQRCGDELAGLVLSGTACCLLPAGSEDLAARVQLAIKQDGVSRHRRSTSPRCLPRSTSHSSRSAPASDPTGFEWLSLYEEEVARYVADPYCGFPFSNGLVLDLAVAGVALWAEGAEACSIPRNLPDPPDRRRTGSVRTRWGRAPSW